MTTLERLTEGLKIFTQLDFTTEVYPEGDKIIVEAWPKKIREETLQFLTKNLGWKVKDDYFYFDCFEEE